VLQNGLCGAERWPIGPKFANNLPGQALKGQEFPGVNDTPEWVDLSLGRYRKGGFMRRNMKHQRFFLGFVGVMLLSFTLVFVTGCASKEEKKSKHFEKAKE